MKQRPVNHHMRVRSTRLKNFGKDLGSNTIFFTMMSTHDREKKFKWIGPIGEGSFSFYKRSDSPFIMNTLDDAKKVACISCRNSGLVYNFLVQAGFKNLDTTTNPSGIYLKVVNKRCDLAIGETHLGVNYWLKRNKLPTTTLKRIGSPILKYPLYIAANINVHDHEIKKWQTALEQIKKSGEFNKIYKQYEH